MTTTDERPLPAPIDALLRYRWVVVWGVLLAVALVLQASPARAAVPWLLGGGSAIAAVPEAVRMIRTLRGGRVGIDVLAIAAVASTLAVGEWWAAAVVVLMLLVGSALEESAAHRARERLSALIADAPAIAHVRVDGGDRDVPVADVAVGSSLVVRPGETVPVDAVLATAAMLDLVRLTGESVPVEAAPGDRVSSGAVVVGAPIACRSVASAVDSEYQRVVRLVADASASRAPMVRLADRYALPFTALSATIAAIGWIVSGDPVRFAEVLVVATPCPLLLAAPIAFVSGIGAAARSGVIVRDGAAIEVLSRVRCVAFDKTGTLTEGRPHVTAVRAVDRAPDELLRIAAAVERGSGHVFAAPIVAEAERRGLHPLAAEAVTEAAGAGVHAVVGAEDVVLGTARFLEGLGVHPAPSAPAAGESVVDVAVGGRFAGAVLLADQPRAEAREVVTALRGLGVEHVLLVTGDRTATAEAIAARIGIDEVHADCRPEDKVRVVRDAQPRPVAMVGDGVNDAPVLAAADVGVAMGARGSGAASEAADVVVLVDDLRRLVDGVRVARRTVRVALQAIGVGIALSIGLMLVAVTGVLPALTGALLQEVVDLVTIVLALRMAGSVRRGRERAGATADRSAVPRA
ncbi:heavy metal translocating P-type ATPase [Amnibacterium kyonggiense]|uniref:Heavy metal-(Cd/Co/Hg/Pb/Zn)-translocating P-type ATPase n=1 Tax=Amnibacterium kyonggiense TaxID=595671 RepID=A0A4R7FKJ9_9MICO|nr:heavy metal translocating P-type ATPase [Amnibacterium kyonggiense]TDS76869.1 heavy metal-(Cd/Co/Hg/Pb/Zn)-translocating P-type ATPase [Amnibacterium kyonggiense]